KKGAFECKSNSHEERRDRKNFFCSVGCLSSKHNSTKWISVKLKKRQSHSSDPYPIRANRGRGKESLGAAVADDIILLNAIAAYAQTAYQHAAFVQRGTAGKENDTALVFWMRRLTSL